MIWSKSHPMVEAHVMYGKVKSPYPTHIWLLVWVFPIVTRDPCLSRIKRWWFSWVTPPNINSLQSDNHSLKIMHSFKFFLHGHACSWFTLFYVVFSHLWTFESVKGRQGYLCYINKTIDNQPSSRLRDGVVNIMGSMFNQNLNTMLPPHLNPYFIWILDVIWWVFMLSVKNFQVEIEGMACSINIFSLKTSSLFARHMLILECHSKNRYH
jgi:hypothetical protein